MANFPTGSTSSIFPSCCFHVPPAIPQAPSSSPAFTLRATESPFILYLRFSLIHTPQPSFWAFPEITAQRCLHAPSRRSTSFKESSLLRRPVPSPFSSFSPLPSSSELISGDI